MGQGVSLVFRILAVAAALFVGLSIAAVVSGVAQPPPAASPSTPPSGSDAAAGALALSCMLISTVFAWMVLRSRLAGSRLVVAIFLAYFGLGTFLPQIESALFLPRHLPRGFVGRLFVMGAVSGLVFAPALALLVGRRGEVPDPRQGGVARLAWRSIALLAALYVAVYFLAGYFIAYRNPELVSYYDDVDPASFLGQLGKVWATKPWLFAFQALRGALFVGCVAPFLLTFLGGRLELGLVIGCAFSVWAAMLLTPNPYMPESVRMSHLVETSTSNFLYGFLVGCILAPEKKGRPENETSGPFPDRSATVTRSANKQRISHGSPNGPLADA